MGCILAKTDLSHDLLHPKFIIERQVSKNALPKTTSKISAFLVLRNTLGYKEKNMTVQNNMDSVKQYNIVQNNTDGA